MPRVDTRVALLVSGVLLAAGAGAETRIEPRVAVGVAYVSNVELAPSNELDDTVGEIRPGISLVHDSARLKLDLDYDLQALFYPDERFFIDFDGRYEQRDVDPAGRAATSNLFRSGNRTDLAKWQVSPWWRQPFGDSTEGTLRYTVGQSDFRNTDETTGNLQDSDLERFDVNLGSPQDATGWTWGLDYLHNRVEYDDTPTYRYERSGGEVGIPVGSRNHVLLAAGAETDLENDQFEGGLDSAWWNVGWRWAPTDRQTLEARVGDRFWGNDFLFSWKRKGSRGDLQLDYSEQPATFGALEFDGADQTPGGIFGPGRIDNRIYISQRLSGSMTWNAPLSDWRLNVYWDQRDYASGGEGDATFTDDEEYIGVRGGIVWRAFARTRFEADLWWEQRNLDQDDFSLLELSVAVVRNLTPNLEARLALGAVEQDADNTPQSVYDANTAYLGIVWRR